MAAAERSSPPWRRTESATEDRDVRAEKIKQDNTSESETPTPENYVYNRENFPPAVMRPESSANFAFTKSLSNTLHDTCQDSPCLKYEGKEIKGLQMHGILPLDTKFDDNKTMIVASFYLRTPGCLKEKNKVMPRIRFTVLRHLTPETDSRDIETQMKTSKNTLFVDLQQCNEDVKAMLVNYTYVDTTTIFGAGHYKSPENPHFDTVRDDTSAEKQMIEQNKGVRGDRR